MSFIELILLLHILTLIQSLNNFDKHSDVKNCVFYDKKSNLPNCTLSIESLHDIQTNCIREGVLRVEGEYNILKLHCTADYGLDFFYNGHQVRSYHCIRLLQNINLHKSLKSDFEGLK